MNKSLVISLSVVLLIVVGVGAYFFSNNSSSENTKNIVENLTTQETENQGGLENQLHPLTIEALKKGEYPGSDLVIEQTLAPGSNYERFIASYKSEGLKIYGLLTIPKTEKPVDGFPVIIFNHGYIPPAQYKTTERYIAYTDAFSRNGYVLFRPDYRGHGNSEGEAAGGYGSNGYTIDVLNAVASVKRLNISSFWQAQRVQNQQKDTGQVEDAREGASMTNLVNNNKIGMWGHSMGGHVTLRNMVVSKDIKAGVIWAGVVASYPDLLNNWRRRNPSATPNPQNTNSSRSWRLSLVEQFGEPETNPTFWNSISASSYLNDISGPLQIHHGTADSSVPVNFSEKLDEQMKAVGKESEIFIYQGDDHNLAANLSTALNRSVQFFDKYLKN